MTLEEAIAALRAKPTQDVPFAGDALSGSKRGASYTAAKNGTLGVPTFWSGGLLRTASLDIARRLGVEDAVAPAKNEQQTKTAPMAAPAEAQPQAVAPAIERRSRKVVIPLAPTGKAPARKTVTPDKPSKSKIRRTA
jgi:hypothetical protein